MLLGTKIKTLNRRTPRSQRKTGHSAVFCDINERQFSAVRRGRTPAVRYALNRNRPLIHQRKEEVLFVIGASRQFSECCLGRSRFYLTNVGASIEFED